MPNIEDKLTKDGYEPRLDEITESLLKAVQRVVREEIELVLGPNSITHSKHLEDAPAVSPRAVSKAEAACILGVSLRTIDECITFKYIGVIRVGHRMLVPMKSLDRVKRWESSIRCDPIVRGLRAEGSGLLIHPALFVLTTFHLF